VRLEERRTIMEVRASHRDRGGVVPLVRPTPATKTNANQHQVAAGHVSSVLRVGKAAERVDGSNATNTPPTSAF